MTKRTWARSAAALAVASLLATACGSDSDSADTTAAADTTTAAADTTAAEVTDTTEAAATGDTEAATEDTEAAAEGGLGEKNPADSSMEPLKVGYMWSGVSPTIDNSSDDIASDAVVKWINEYGGGVAGGHPLELVKCQTNSDAAVAATCGPTLLDAGVPAVLFDVVGEIEPWATPVLAEKIPIFAYSSADKSLLTPGDPVFTLSNPVAGLGFAPAALAKQLGVTKSAMVVIDVPAASGPVSALTPIAFESTGAGAVDIVPISPTAPDHGPAIQVELQNNPELVAVVGNPAFCSLTIRALKDAGYTGAISIISNCLDDAAREQLGADIEGVWVSYSAGEDPANADYQQFSAIMAEYAPDTAPTGTAVGSYVVLEGFRRIMEDFTGDFTPQTITDHIRNHAALPVPTIDNAEFKCDGTAVAIVPIACTSAFAYAQLDDKGQPTAFTGFG